MAFFRSRRLLGSLLAALAAAWLFARNYEPISDTYLDVGEALVHGIAPRASKISYYGPFASVSAALLFAHNGGLIGQRAARAVLFGGVNILLAALTLSPAPLLALAYSYWATELLVDFPELLFTLLMLLIVAVMMWRARRPSWRRSLVLGLAVGASLIYRSPLAFFPPLLALYEWAFPYKRSLRLYWRHALLLCVLPYLILLPWLRMNWTVFRQIIPFENGEANSNIVVGALGLTRTIDGNWQMLIDDPSVDAGKNREVLAWAVRRALRRPFPYAAAYFSRVVYIFWMNPLIFLLAAWGLWKYRRREEVRQTALLAAYWVAVHCFMSVTSNYTIPLWNLTSILAGLAASPWLARSKFAPSRAFFRIFRGGMSICLAVIGALCLGVSAYVVRYDLRARAGMTQSLESLDDAVARNPDDAWPFFMRGRRRLDQGRIQEAKADLARVVALDPDFPLATLYLAWSQMLLGDPNPLIEWRSKDDTYNAWDHNFETHILKAHGYARFGRLDEARQELRVAVETYRIRARVRGPTEIEMRTYAKLQDVSNRWNAARMLAETDTLLASRPAKERLAVDRELGALLPPYAAFRLDLASLALEAGERPAALSFLAEAERLGIDPGDQARRISLRENLHLPVPRPKRPLEPAANPPTKPGRGGDDSNSPQKMISLYRRRREYGKALAALDRLIAASPKSAALRLEAAAIALEAGDRGRAASSLGQIRSLRLDDEERHQTALLYQALKDYPSTLAILDALARERPGDASVMADKGLCEYLSGNAERAVADLRAAIRLDPTRYAAYLTLGSIYSAQGKNRELVELYESGLALNSGKRDESLRKLMVRDLREARGRLGK